MKNNLLFTAYKESTKAKNVSVELLEKLTEKSSLVGLINYFRILEALIVLFLLYICMDYVRN